MLLNFLALSTAFCPRLFEQKRFLLVRPHGLYIFDISRNFKRVIHSSSSYIEHGSSHRDLNLIYFKKSYFAL